MPKTKVEVYDKNQLIYPFIESDHVTFSNGMKVSEMLDQSISMPKVIHEDLSFKVGVGDQDVSSAIVDSSVAEMTIKGKTYQNILPEPSTHVLTNNKEMFKVNEGLDPNVEIVDGVSKSAILSGSTERRVSKNLFNGRIRNNADISSATGQESQTGNRTISLDYTPVLPSTQYTFTRPINTMQMGYRLYRSDKSFIKFQALGNNLSASFTTTSDTAYFKFIDEANTLTEGYQLELGSVATEYEPYFEPHLVSCKMPILTTVGKNLFDGKLENGFLSDSTGQPNTGNKHKYTPSFIKIDASKKYCLHVEADSFIGIVNAYYYDYNKNYLGFGRDIISGINTNISKLFTPHYSNASYIRFRFFKPNNVELSVDPKNIAFYESSTIIDMYEPHKSNTLTTPEDLELRSLPNGICDTLNLNTGEYVQRIGEITFNGSETWQESGNVAPNHYCAFTRVEGSKNVLSYNIMCNSLPVKNILSPTIDSEGCMFNEWASGDKANVVVKIANSKLSSTSVNGIKAYLQSNPLTVQYELATPIIKTVDLSSSGNWEKVVLDGSETGWSNSYSGWVNKVFCLNNRYLPNVIKPTSIYGTYVMCDKLRGYTIQWLCEELGRTGVALHSWGSGYLQIAINGVNTVDELKQYLSQNPITVWYQTATTLDSTKVKQPIFFKDGHIIQTSGTNNSLIPTLDYQAKTSNSYVMDLMKTNTKYTMKAKSASGTFTIDGTSYGAGINGTFTTPISMANKFLVMSSKTNEEVMILEGDVTGKTIPYFKGIKSAFEDEGKIEVLSTGKNLFNLNNIIQGNNADKTGWENIVTNDGVISKRLIQDGGRFACAVKVYVKPSTTYTLSFEHYRDGMLTEQTPTYIYHNSGLWGNILAQTNNTNLTFTTKPETEYIVISVNYGSNTPVGETWETKNIQLQENPTVTDYEPYKSNTTKIPLLSPLRSLPNGVCDELIVDRMKNKATLIQRVEAIPVTSVDDIRLQANLGKYNRFFIHKRQTTHPTFNMSSTGSQLSNWCPHHSGFTTDSYHFYVDGAGDIMLFDKSETLNSIRTKMSQSPFVALHQLATPIVTEVDLEGFPYIYKDGHIFLNSEIVPITEITYSINQCQQISASNEDIIRHEKELTYLQKLIAQYVQVDYESALLSLKV